MDKEIGREKERMAVLCVVLYVTGGYAGVGVGVDVFAGLPSCLRLLSVLSAQRQDSGERCGLLLHSSPLPFDVLPTCHINSPS